MQVQIRYLAPANVPGPQLAVYGPPSTLAEELCAPDPYFVPSPPPGTVPAASPLGLALLSVALVFAGRAALRRRSAA